MTEIGVSNRCETRAQPLRWIVLAAFAAMLLWSSRAFLDFGELFLDLHGKNFLERGAIGASEWQCFLSRAGRRERQEISSKAHRELALATHGGAEPAKVIFSGATVAIVNPWTHSRSRGPEPITVVRSEHDLPSELLSKGSAALVRSEREFSSDIEDGWLWTVELGQRLPANAKVFLNVPSMMLYYFSTFMCYPRRIDVDTHLTKITDDDTLQTVFKTNLSRLDPANLVSLGQKLRLLGYTHLVIRKDDELQLVTLVPEDGIP